MKIFYLIIKNIFKNFQFYIKTKLDLDSLRENLIAKDKTAFTDNIFTYLDESKKKELYNFFSKVELIDKVSLLLGTRCKLQNVLIAYNFYNENTKENEGSKMWHRDSDSLSDQMKIFIPLTRVDSNNGKFYFISNEYVSYDKKFRLDKKKMRDPKISVWNKFRTEIFKYLII